MTDRLPDRLPDRLHDQGPDRVPDRLPDELRALGRALDVPAPSPDSVAEQVLARLLAEAAAAPRRRVRIRRWLRARRRALVAALSGLLLVLAVTPPVRAAVADWLDFGGVRVRQEASATPAAGSPPPVRGSVELRDAARWAGFTPLVPATLGAPDGVAVTGATGGRVVSMSWRAGGGTVRLDQFRATLDPMFLKSAGDSVSYVEVGGQMALWFAEPHYLALVDEYGKVRHEAARAAGPTLVWQAGGLTLRLEGVASKDRALDIAESGGSAESAESTG